MKTYYVYILLCSDNTYYTGVTSNLNDRIEEHRTGKYKDSYTFSRRPIKLVYHCQFTNPNLAISLEKQVKKWSSQKKRALIDGEYDKLPNLSKKKFGTL
ncbi:GIY-YIG nuclease family protein [Flagellimonas pelagia]|uniref:GIY-YIG nuclease family protein n=1 Tax=Flagellimonas pelagia TaxID=2306998 RepID=A0A3A1NC13_9FLAO|nr:GIY-YIG nuclease family protein [Allomuricauda maritima]RIV41866.1 GIY-YIG nuclease family protein [Allomuricauda maritima]TXJ90742.1 GIY-YIG nuclease family protein [Allomuricauda maritima]